MTDHHPNSSYLPRQMPPELARLTELAIDLRWNWNHSADRLWETIDPALWNATGNAWLILDSVSDRRLRELAADPDFVAELNRLVATRDEYAGASTWFSENCRDSGLGTVAYFSMEFGLGESLPIYSGGLGILAGDHLKTASDLGVPLVGVGLLYQQGYFRQTIDANGEQLAFYPYNDPTLLPALPLRNAGGEWLRVEVTLPGRILYLRTWEVQVGRSRLYLLDSNHPLNAPSDRGITGELYGGSLETRLQQELVLGIGGWRLLRALEIDVSVCHLNEGHAAFVILERARSFMEATNCSFQTALRCTAAGNIFTSHTPVEAGFDRFPRPLISQYLSVYTRRFGVDIDTLLSLGQTAPGREDEPFNMAWLAVRGCCRVNGVSRLHGKVSRGIFQPLFPDWPQVQVPIGHVTNGVHTPSWDSAAADELWTETCGKERWLGTLETLEEQFRAVSDEALWRFRSQQRHTLIYHVRHRTVRQQRARGLRRDTIEAIAAQLDPNTLTIGFARRFATYKRPELLLHDPERLVRLLTNPRRPVQLVVAGKAHPKDEAGRHLVRQWNDFMRRPELADRVVFVEDYDIGLATELVQGMDLWINTPRRPWEASGTSGMKVLVNGGLNLSELDGWWVEAYDPAVGWALGDRREHDSDPAWDHHEANQLYRLLEEEVVPAFYDCNERGIPTRWVATVRESMARLTPRFSTNRMVREYVEHYYLPAAADWQRRKADGGALGKALEEWRRTTAEHWPRLRFGNCVVESDEERHHFTVQVYLDDVVPSMVRVELYADPRQEGDHSVWPMDRMQPLSGTDNSFVFEASVPADRPANHYTPRLVAHHPAAHVPIENAVIHWMQPCA